MEADIVLVRDSSLRRNDEIGLLNCLIIKCQHNLVHLFDDAIEWEQLNREIDSVPDELSRGEGRGVSRRLGDWETLPNAPDLSPRELEVLRLVALGRDVPGMAEELGISQHTVRNHIRHFRAKLNAPTRLDAVVAGLRLGILTVH